MTPFSLEPPPVNGVHQWLPRQVRRAANAGFPRDYVQSVFRPRLDALFASGVLRREVTDRDLTEVLNFIFGARGNQDAPPVAGPMTFDPLRGWPANVTIPRSARDPRLVVRALRESPVKGTAQIPPHRALPSTLFRPGDLLCVGRDAAHYFVLPAEDLDAAAPDLQFVVPNPLRKRAGITLSGRQTCHCRDATGDRRYLVFESDAGDALDDQVALLFWLAAETETNLRAVITSGKKSVHGWFDVTGVPPPDLFAWFVNCAIPLGADPRLIVPEQFVRMPGGVRDSGARQEILFLK